MSEEPAGTGRAGGQAPPRQSAAGPFAEAHPGRDQSGSSQSRPARSLEENAGWGSVSTPAPDWAVAPSPAEPVAAAKVAVASASVRTPQAPDAPGAGARAVRESLGAARRAGTTASTTGEIPAAASTDDSAVSEDDEDIEVSSDVGRAVIEKVLGGRVIAETED